MNAQPWRFLVGRSGTRAARTPPGRRSTPRLAEGNRLWADRAPVLILAVTQTTQRGRHPSAGGGVRARPRGLPADHAGARRRPARAPDGRLRRRRPSRCALSVPAEFTPYVVIAVGRRGADDHLPEFLRDREAAPRERLPLIATCIRRNVGTTRRPSLDLALSTRRVPATGPARVGRTECPEDEAVPTYQYVCTECGEPLEAVQSFTDAALTTCPVCGGQLRKVFSAVGVVFKGSGFYRNDSRTSLRRRSRQRLEQVASTSSSSDSSTRRSSKGESGTSKEVVRRAKPSAQDGSSPRPSQRQRRPSPAAPAPPPGVSGVTYSPAYVPSDTVVCSRPVDDGGGARFRRLASLDGQLQRDPGRRHPRRLRVLLPCSTASRRSRSRRRTAHPSEPPLVGEVGGRRVAFIPRHGKDHRFPPHRVPYQANLWALRSLGVRQVLAPSAVGGAARIPRPGHARGARPGRGPYVRPDADLLRRGRRPRLLRGPLLPDGTTYGPASPPRGRAGLPPTAARSSSSRVRGSPAAPSPGGTPPTAGPSSA